MSDPNQADETRRRSPKPKTRASNRSDATDPETLALAEDLRRVVGNLVRTVRHAATTPTTSQSETLGFLDRKGPMSIADLARLRNVKHQSMRLVLAQLEADGLVRRTVSPDDARSQRVEISDAGREALVASRAARARWIAEGLLDRLTEDERKDLRSAIESLQRLLPPED